MKVSKKSRLTAQQLFRACAAQGTLDENHVRQVVRRLLEGKPRGYLAILSHFQRLVKLDLERRSARIETATPLEPQTEALLKAQLAKSHGSSLEFTFVQNPALIGGMRIRIGNDVYDGSVQARLASIQESFEQQ